MYHCSIFSYIYVSGVIPVCVFFVLVRIIMYAKYLERRDAADPNKDRFLEYYMFVVVVDGITNGVVFISYGIAFAIYGVLTLRLIR